MDVPKRMPVWSSVDPIRLHWLSMVVTGDVAYGLVNMFGKAETASQILLRSILPLPVWYGALVLAAVLIAFGFSIPGGMIGTGAFGALAVASVSTIVHGTAQSYGGPILLAVFGAGPHILITYDVGSGLDDRRERQQRA